MLITMLIEGRATKRLVVPSGAVVRDNDLDHIFIESTPGVTKLTRVQLGPDTAGVRAVLDAGLENRRVVLDGAFHVNNQRLKNLQEQGAAGKS